MRSAISKEPRAVDQAAGQDAPRALAARARRARRAKASMASASSIPSVDHRSRSGRGHLDGAAAAVRAAPPVGDVGPRHQEAAASEGIGAAQVDPAFEADRDSRRGGPAAWSALQGELGARARPVEHLVQATAAWAARRR